MPAAEYRREQWAHPELVISSRPGRHTQTKQPFTLTPTANLESPINLHVFESHYCKETATNALEKERGLQ